MLNSIKISHLCEDEKFINSAIEQFEFSFPGQNKFYVFPVTKNNSLKHITPHRSVSMTNEEHLISSLSTIKKSSILILHGLSPRFYNFVLSVHERLPIICLFFGFEIYNDPKIFNKNILLDQITRRKFSKNNISLIENIKNVIRPFFRFFRPSLPLTYGEAKFKVLNRINYFGCPYHEEYMSILKLTGVSGFLFKFSYFPLEYIVDVNKPINSQKKILLIGNSGFKTLNHLDVFYKIKNYSLNDIEINVPLNYGNSFYINEVLKEGAKVFKDNFKPLIDFIPLNEYNVLLDSVGVAIFNCKRQQAIGNTISLLWLGAKVFLSEYNSFYQYLRRIGVVVFSYENELNNFSISKLLTPKEIKHNRFVLYNEFNKSKLSDLLKNQILKINN
ncbi:MAG: TDP-N-acetylfucosamine:lipid II N-acetylfucosaminyltransferase [Flavobacteriaceae bacterium]|nr:TDP-N-acetylfucosamine:lipid II N-acetylfucosaminyltransferase [Flavobacteriaceae bacterium]